MLLPSAKLHVSAPHSAHTLTDQVIRYPLQLEPMTRFKYYEEREKFDPTTYLKNPMVMMGLMAAFMAFVMPKMVCLLLPLLLLLLLVSDFIFLFFNPPSSPPRPLRRDPPLLCYYGLNGCANLNGLCNPNWMPPPILAIDPTIFVSRDERSPNLASVVLSVDHRYPASKTVPESGQKALNGAKGQTRLRVFFVPARGTLRARSFPTPTQTQRHL